MMCPRQPWVRWGRYLMSGRRCDVSWANAAGGLARQGANWTVRCPRGGMQFTFDIPVSHRAYLTPPNWCSAKDGEVLLWYIHEACAIFPFSQYKLNYRLSVSWYGRMLIKSPLYVLFVMVNLLSHASGTPRLFSSGSHHFSTYTGWTVCRRYPLPLLLTSVYWTSFVPRFPSCPLYTIT